MYSCKYMNWKTYTPGDKNERRHIKSLGKWINHDCRNISPYHVVQNNLLESTGGVITTKNLELWATSPHILPPPNAECVQIFDKCAYHNGLQLGKMGKELGENDHVERTSENDLAKSIKTKTCDARTKLNQW